MQIYYRGTIEEVLNKLRQQQEENRIKGEMTLLIEGREGKYKEKEEMVSDEAIIDACDGSSSDTSISKLAKEISNKLNIKKTRVYKLLLKKYNST